MLKLEDRLQFVRVFPQLLIRLAPKEPDLQLMYVRQNVRIPDHHQSSRLSSLVVRYNDYVNHTSGLNRRIKATKLVNGEDFRTDGSENVYNLAESKKQFTFELTIGSAFHDIVELTPALQEEWRHRNLMEQQRYRADLAPDDDVDPWYNRWYGSVNVCLVFNRLTGVYEVFHEYNTAGKGMEPKNPLGNDKQHSNFGGLLSVATLGTAKLEFEIRAQTKLNEGSADILLDIREDIKTKTRP